MHYFHDGYFYDPDGLAKQVIRYLEEGWKIEAVLPPTASRGTSLVVSHPELEVPSWEK